MKYFSIIIVFLMCILSYSCEEKQTQKESVDYSETDSIAAVDAKRFLRAVCSKKLSEMQLQDSVLSVKSRLEMIKQKSGSDIANRYSLKFEAYIKEHNDSISKILFPSDNILI